MAAEPLQDAIEALDQAGQAHLVAHADGLPPEERASFLTTAAAVPWRVLQQAVEVERSHSPALRHPQTLTWRRQMAQGVLRPRLEKLGRGLLAGGRVAALLLAGGQGTRLGFDGPKGNVVFGPEPDRTLYRIHAERIAAASAQAGRPVPLFVLVSCETADATRAAFAADGAAWGLEPDQVRFLEQAELPCLDAQGRALVAAPGILASAPDGHGGAFGALRHAGLIHELADRGVDVLVTYQVDNPLGRPLDPVMLGWMVDRRLQAVGKAVRKAGPDEAVGVFARDLKGCTRIVEYSERPAQTGSEGDVRPDPGEATAKPLDLGSIAIHGFAVQWLRKLEDAGTSLPLHRAHKRVPHIDPSGKRVEPTEANAWKLERFIFDLFPLATRAEVHEVERAQEFAPVKNATGVDSLESARALVAAEVRRWHRERDLPEPANPSLRPRELDGV